MSRRVSGCEDDDLPGPDLTGCLFVGLDLIDSNPGRGWPIRFSGRTDEVLDVDDAGRPHQTVHRHLVRGHVSGSERTVSLLELLAPGRGLRIILRDVEARWRAVVGGRAQVGTGPRVHHMRVDPVGCDRA